MGKPNTTEFTSSGNGYEKADSRYYVNPKKIVLGSKKGVTEENVANFPYACSEEGYNNGAGGMFIDSGASFTRLPQEVLDDVTEHVTKLMEKKPKQNDSPNNNRFSCYDRKLPEDMPDMVLHFCNGAEMVIPVDNYMLQDREEYCLVFEKPKRNDGIPHGMSILGNFQQQDMTMLFDIKEKKLLFMENKGCQAGEKKHAAV